MKTQLEVGGEPAKGRNLAQLLEGEEGTFLCQSGGRFYLTIAAPGHSIVSGPTPIGQAVIESPSAAQETPYWVVTKITNAQAEEWLGKQSGGKRS